MSENGEGVPETDKTAVKWFTLAAKQGDVNAQGYLGLMYQNGEGVLENDKTAVEWLTLAAKQGYAKAQYNLGIT
jgi:TPR repeat protein